MSHDESAALDSMRQTIRWLIGGIASLIGGAAIVGGWVATQEGKIVVLQDADRSSLQDRSELRGQMRGQADTLTMLRQDAALQNRDLQYIREAVTKIEKIITKP
jgi:hypothetical protein